MGKNVPRAKSEGRFLSLEQGWANYSLWAKFGPCLVFINKFYWNTQPRPFISVLCLVGFFGCFLFVVVVVVITAEWSSCDTDHMARKAKNI